MPAAPSASPAPSASAAPPAFSPHKRNARGELIPKKLSCARCTQYIHDLDAPLCDGKFSGTTQHKRCTRCSKGRRQGCAAVTHADLVPGLNQLLTAREEAEAARGGAGEEDAQLVLDAQQEEFNGAIKMFHNNKNKAVGDTRMPSTPNSGGMLAPPLRTAGPSLEEMQRLRRAGNTIAVAGRELVRHFAGDGAASLVDAALNGEDAPEEEAGSDEE